MINIRQVEDRTGFDITVGDDTFDGGTDVFHMSNDNVVLILTRKAMNQAGIRDDDDLVEWIKMTAKKLED